MLKNKYTCKDTISMSERISATEFIVNSYFQTNGENGITGYVPYFHELAEVFVFTDYFLQGYTFTEEESKYEIIMNDKELQRLYEEFYNDNKCFAKILANAGLMVDFRKQKILHPIGELINEVTKFAQNMDKNLDMNTIGEFAKKLSSVDEKTLADIIQHKIKTNIKSEEPID